MISTTHNRLIIMISILRKINQTASLAQISNTTILFKGSCGFAQDGKKGGSSPGGSHNDKSSTQSKINRMQTPIDPQRVTIPQHFQVKSAGLYDKYMQERERPVMCLDNYQLYYELIIQRPPIFAPFQQRNFQTYRNRYCFSKKAGFYRQVPKQLRLNDGDYVFEQFDDMNEDNIPTHQININAAERILYRQHSRHWKYTDPNIIDPHSIQTYSSNNVFFIIQDRHTGKWVFPNRAIKQKENHAQIFNTLTEDLFGGSNKKDVYFYAKKPSMLSTVERDDLPKGKGIRYLTFKGLSISGLVTKDSKWFQDYAWVPKPLLGKYFDDDYFNRVIKAVTHTF